MGNPQKAKGDAYERDLAKYFNEHIYKEERCSRAPLSGGGRIGIGVGGADLLGTPEIFIEAKRVERLNFRDAMAQAERNIIQTHAPEVPVVITRRSRETIEDSLVVMRLKDWELMYGAYLRATSHMRDDTLLKPD
jgi:hypothetical protein